VKIQIDEKIRKSPRFLPKVEQANAILSEFAHRSSEAICLNWSIDVDQQLNPLICLTLTDSSFSTPESEGWQDPDLPPAELQIRQDLLLTPDDLLNQDRLESRLSELWRSVLAERSRVQLQRLRVLVSHLPEDV